VAEFILRRIQILLGANRVEEILELRPRRNTSHEQLTVGQAHLAAAGGVKERKASSSYRHRREKAPPTDSDTTHARARPPDSDNGRRRRQQTNKQTNEIHRSVSKVEIKHMPTCSRLDSS